MKTTKTTKSIRTSRVETAIGTFIVETLVYTETLTTYGKIVAMLDGMILVGSMIIGASIPLVSFIALIAVGS
jgi:hypothetical protein